MSADYRNLVRSHNPATFWRLAEKSGTVVEDDAENEVHGTYLGLPILGAAPIIEDDADTSVDFDGNDDRIEIAAHPILNSPNMTIEGWVTPDVIGSIMMIASKGSFANTWRLWVRTGALIEFDALADAHNLVSVTKAQATQRMYVAATYDAVSQLMKLFINGGLEATKTNVTTIGSDYNNSLFIARDEGGSNRFNGRMAKFAYYQRALTDDDILSHWEMGIAANQGVQPLLLPEEPFGEVERSWMESEPPGLLPENQDSNYGQVRKVVSDVLQNRITEIDLFYDESSPITTREYIDWWEEMSGVPLAPSKTLENRRAIVLDRFKYGPFTRTRRVKLVEKFIEATFGQSPQLTTEGIALDAAGVALFSDVISVAGQYFIVEYVEDFSYAVFISEEVAPDIDGMKRELERMTPAGIRFSVSFVDMGLIGTLYGLSSYDESLYG